MVFAPFGVYSICGINAFKSTKSQSFIRLYNLAGRTCCGLDDCVIQVIQICQILGNPIWVGMYRSRPTWSYRPDDWLLLYCSEWLHLKSCSYSCR